MLPLWHPPDDGDDNDDDDDDGDGDDDDDNDDDRMEHSGGVCCFSISLHKTDV